MCESTANGKYRWVSLVDKEFHDLFIDIGSDEGETSPGKIERAKRLEKRLEFGNGGPGNKCD